MEPIVQLNSPRALAPKRSRKKQSAVPPRVRTQFAYPKNIKGCDIKWSRKGRKLIEAVTAYVEPRLLPKLQARTAGRPDCNRHDAIDVEFLDACIYLRSWLGYGESCGIAEFPFARLYPVAGRRYNLWVRRLIDWSRAEDDPIGAVFNAFWFQAPNAKFWVRLATHKTFEECIDLLAGGKSF